MNHPPRLTAAQLAELVGGELVGRSDVLLAGVRPLERAGPGDLSFLASARYLPYFERSNAGAVLLGLDFRDLGTGPATRIVVPDPYAALAVAIRELNPEPSVEWGVDSTARIGTGARWLGRVSLGARAVLGEGAQLGRDCVIGPYAVIGDGARLGDGCHVHASVEVCAGTILGNRVVLHSGARVGTPGFGYHRTAAGHARMPHTGGCLIGDDVEIGANTTIDKGSVDNTVIGEGTKIDNLVQVAHNVKIGKRCLIMAQVGIAGSTDVEDDVVLAGQAGLAGHLKVGRGARVAAQSGVIGDVPAGTTVSGYPARRHRNVLRQAAAVKRLAPLVNRIERMVQQDGEHQEQQ